MTKEKKLTKEIADLKKELKETRLSLLEAHEIIRNLEFQRGQLLDECMTAYPVKYPST